MTTTADNVTASAARSITTAATTTTTSTTPLPITTLPITSPSTTKQITVTNATLNSTTPPQDTSVTGMTAGEEAAIGVCVSAAIIIFAALAVVWYIRKKRRPKDPASSREEHSHIYYNDPGQSPTGSPSEQPGPPEYFSFDKAAPDTPTSDSIVQQNTSPIYVNHHAKRALLPPPDSAHTGRMSPGLHDADSTTNAASRNVARSPKMKRQPQKPSPTASPHSAGRGKALVPPGWNASGGKKIGHPEKILLPNKKKVKTTQKQQEPTRNEPRSIPDHEEYVEIFPDSSIEQRKKKLLQGINSKPKQIPASQSNMGGANKSPAPQHGRANAHKPNPIDAQHSYLELLPDEQAASDEMYSYAETKFPFGKKSNSPEAGRQDSVISTNYYNIPEDSSYQNVDTRK